MADEMKSIDNNGKGAGKPGSDCFLDSGGGVAGSGACRLSNGCGDGRNASSRLKSGSPGLALLPKCALNDVIAIGEEGVRLWAEAGNGCHNGVIINY
ncbi:hypothetical protein Tco_0276091 [Tanacetum coccineum]